MTKEEYAEAIGELSKVMYSYKQKAELAEKDNVELTRQLEIVNRQLDQHETKYQTRYRNRIYAAKKKHRIEVDSLKKELAHLKTALGLQAPYGELKLPGGSK